MGDLKNIMYPRMLLILNLFLVACQGPLPAKKNAPPADGGQNEPSTKDSGKKNITDSKSAFGETIKWPYEKAANDTLFFKNGSLLKTDLFNLTYIGQIASNNGAPFIIFAGRDCEECDANISLYIHSPDQGKLNVEHGANRYPYPGVEKDYETGKVLYNARAFYGQIMDDKVGVVWYEQHLMDDDKMRRSTFVIENNGAELKDTAYLGHAALEKTIALMEKGLCFEIKGKTYSSEP